MDRAWGYSRSMMVTLAIPPPSHIVCKPSRPPRFRVTGAFFAFGDLRPQTARRNIESCPLQQTRGCRVFPGQESGRQNHNAS
jgi:hypothetical protein